MLNDDAYDNRSYVPEANALLEQMQTGSAELRALEASLGRARLNEPYGPGLRERYDLYHPSGPAAGLVVFVHGGYWRAFGREDWALLSRGAVARGWAVAVPSYTLAPEAPIAEMTRQMARAVTAAARRVSGPIVLCGHSAGGHLVARLATTDVPLAVADRLARVLPISPLGDLRPLLETSMNRDLQLDAESAAAESPVLQTPRAGLAVEVWVGGAERPAFLDQARRLAETWGAGLEIVPGRHHFDIISGLADADSPMIAAALRNL